MVKTKLDNEIERLEQTKISREDPFNILSWADDGLLRCIKEVAIRLDALEDVVYKDSPNSNANPQVCFICNTPLEFQESASFDSIFDEWRHNDKQVCIRHLITKLATLIATQ